METVIRLIRHLAIHTDSAPGVEEYYSKLQRHGSVDGPSFAEAVDDYQALRRQRNGYLLF